MLSRIFFGVGGVGWGGVFFNCPLWDAIIIIIIRIILIVIIIMTIGEAPTLRLKAFNKQSVTHIMYIEMENVISNLTEAST